MQHLDTLRLIEAIAPRRFDSGKRRRIPTSPRRRSIAVLAVSSASFGSQIFERPAARQWRLNPAGELGVQHYRAQRSDLARVQSQVADLTGGTAWPCHDRLFAGPLAVLTWPQQIAAYRNAHPGVTFAVNVARPRTGRGRNWSVFRSDLAPGGFEPRVLVDFEVLHALAAGRSLRASFRAGPSACRTVGTCGCAIVSITPT